MDTRVLVAGAGPAGLMVALELARYGVAVRIVDKAKRRDGHSKALFLWSRTLELLDRAGCGAAFVAAGHQINATQIIANNQMMGRVDFATVDSPHPYALLLPQSKTEELLEAALNRLGVRVERGVELGTFLETANDVKSLLVHDDGRQEEVASAWVIGCDGAGSLVRNIMGVAFESHTPPSDWVLAEAQIAGLACPDNEITAFWHEDGFLAMFPLGRGRYRIIADQGQARHALQAAPTLHDVQELVVRRGPGGLVVFDAAWVWGFRVQEQNAGQYRQGRVFLAGDAAHVHNPAGAQGMNMGIHDAVNLAWKLALVEQGGWRDELLLDSYETERRGMTEHVIKNVARLTAVSMVKNHTMQTVRNFFGGFLLGLAPARQALAEQVTELSLRYRPGGMIGPEDGSFPVAVPGERMPVMTGGALLFTLYAAPSAAARRFLQDFAGVVAAELQPPPAVGCMWLVRPDGYVAAVGLEADIAVFYEYFERIRVKAALAAV